VEIRPLKLTGSFELTLKRVEDERGFFLRIYDAETFAKYDLQTNWEHDSLSFNLKRDTIRGLHFQMPPFEETKLVRVSQGAIWDVIVDLRKDSGTYGQWEGVELSAENNKCLYIPRGFAHGFCTLTDSATVNYKIDMPYKADAAAGIRWNDPTLGITWRAPAPVISDRDKELQFFADLVSPF
jgi:dTDP-4-dehydrorhamnose 3,5-epimerase